MKLRLYRVKTAPRKMNRILDFVSIEDKPKLVVDPLAAMGTDVIGLGLSAALAFSPLPWPLRILGVLGGAWMGTALVTEASKLTRKPEPLVREHAPLSGYSLRLRLRGGRS